jgi:thiamine kinase-like enzyme
MLTDERTIPIHLGAYPVDPGFPQLEVACDAVRMRDVFRTHLRPVSGRALEIVECAPFRYRCHQSATRCVLQYTLRLEEPGGRPRPLWVTGLIYAEPGEAERVWRRMSAREAGHEIPEEWRTFDPVSFIPELDMVVEVFPFDRRLPQLGRVMNGATLDLGRMLLEGLGPGRWQAGDARLEPTRYRTELGAVLRYTVPARDLESGRTERPGCYLKVYRDQRGKETFEFLKSWEQRAALGANGYSLARPLAYWDELRTLVLEEAPGVSLRERLLGGDDAESAVRAAARAIAAFNQEPITLPRTYSAEDQWDTLSSASALVQWARPLKRAKIAGVTAVAKRYLENVPPAPIHRDLTPEHVLLSGDRVILIDTDSVAMGDPVRDPALLFAHITSLLADPAKPDVAHPLASAFVEEYFAHVPAAWRKRLRYQCAGAFIEVAAGIFRSHEPGWPERVADAAGRARHALVGEFG